MYSLHRDGNLFYVSTVEKFQNLEYSKICTDVYLHFSICDNIHIIQQYVNLGVKTPYKEL